MRFLIATVFAASAALPATASAQTMASAAREGADRRPERPTVAAARLATATRAERAPVIDGRDADAAWAGAQVIDGFRTFDPVEDGDPRFRTEARVTYDDRNLYVFVRAHDARPDSIVSLLSRRDVRTQSDQIKVMIDSYHDRRTGFQFAVNPAGVKRDFSIINDGEEDASWDAVWEAATQIDSAGWTAEFRIPFNQLRYSNAEAHTFGLGIWRDVARFNERYSWPVYKRSGAGMVSQFGEIHGFQGIASPRRLEFAPYTVTRTYNAQFADGWRQRNGATVGADLKYGITPNLTVDATVNPDFGQVEADPSVLNLSAFETFFPEKRPFFLEGQGLFRFDVNCNDGQCSGLFYSRRIGRDPQLGGTYADPSNPTSSTILGAAKLTGRMANGLSLGILNAVTQREADPRDRTIEPQSNFLVARAQKDFRSGGSGIGVMGTAVRRGLDEWSEDFMRRNAYTGGIDARHQFHNRQYAISAYLAGSHVEGSAASIARLQRSSVHYYQRPDDGNAYDPTATSMAGYSSQVNLEKRGGGRTRFSTGLQFISPGFEINDVGFLSRANSKSQFLWYQIQWNKPKPDSWYRFGNMNFNQWANWSWNNERTEVGGNFNTHWQFANSMWAHFGQGVNAAVPSYCDNCTRGGPALRQDRSFWGWGGVEGDPRRRIVPNVFADWGHGDEGRSTSLGVSGGFTFRVASRLNGSLSYRRGHNINATQWNGNFGALGSDTTHYTFAELDQITNSMTARVSFTATPTLSLQVYAQPFATRGAFSDWMEVSDPRAEQWTSRYRPYNGGDPGAFDFKQYRSNSVVRWEYKPGSTLYFVWAQERSASQGGAAARTATHSLLDLRKAHPANVFLIKGSYWMSM